MKLNALDLYNLLQKYSENELKEFNVVIEISRSKHNQLGTSEYATHIEQYPSQIRIVNKS